MTLVLMTRNEVAGARRRRIIGAWVLALSVLLPGALRGAALDAAVAEDPLLGVVAEALGAWGIDVTTNLNARPVMGERLDAPRLGRFADLPVNHLAGTAELLAWEAAYASVEIAALAIFADANAAPAADAQAFLARWLDGTVQERVLVTFLGEDLATIESVQRVLAGYGYPTLLLQAAAVPAIAGELYATAAQRLALDTRAARRYKSEIPELAYLGERARRNSDSLFKPDGNRGEASLASGEPAVFLKETLGDEFTQSTIREIVVPGGVALGETARLTIAPAQLRFADSALRLVDTEARIWDLPAMDSKTLKALFDFVSRSEAIRSDAIVDIDGDGRVRIAAALRDTDAGFAIMEADIRPFEYVRNLDVTKSVIVDTRVRWYAGDRGGDLQFDTGFEVRFLSADNMRIAQTRAALAYAYDAATDEVQFSDTWGRDAKRLHEDLDYSGLGTSVVAVARYAGWIALLRLLQEQGIPFVHGRYEFMKIDKSGRNTPSRY